MNEPIEVKVLDVNTVEVTRGPVKVLVHILESDLGYVRVDAPNCRVKSMPIG